MLGDAGYGEALDLLDRFGATFGPVWDESTASNVFEYVDPRSGTRHQVWYESPQSLQVKYAAFVEAGVLGVGMWIGSDFHRGDPVKSKAAAAAMWAAVPELNHLPRFPSKMDDVVWLVPSTEKLKPTDAVPERLPEFALSAAKGEWESFQIVIANRGAEDLVATAVAVEIGAGPGRLGNADAAWIGPPAAVHRVGYINVVSARLSRRRGPRESQQ